MVTSHHEASHRIFQEQPGLLGPAFDILNVPLPEKSVCEVLTPDATEIRPLERRVDTVLRLTPPEGGPLLVAVEAQGRRDPAKAVSWAYYLSFLKAKHECPALLLVVCDDTATAAWAEGPFQLGTDEWTALSVHPLVLGPGNVPLITDPEQAAQDLALAAFSAMTHGRDPRAPAILKAMARALHGEPREVVTYYTELLEVGLRDSPAREIWRDLVLKNGSFFPGRGTLIEETFLKGEAKGKAEGKAEGKVEAKLEERARFVVYTLEHRGLDVPDMVRERVAACTDLDALERWLERAFTVDRAEELFAGE